MSLGLQWEEVKKNEDDNEKEEQNMKKRREGEDNEGEMGEVEKKE
jgi:hypothetical protein